jgi:predicted negative regulator of RcsB-dependent stress response
MDDAAQLPLSDRLHAWFETNKKQALWGAVIIVAAGLVIGYYSWHKAEKEVDAGEALSAVSVPHAAGLTRGSAADAYLKVANQYSGTKAAVRAMLLAAADDYSEGKFDQARAKFEQFRREHGDSPLAGQAMLGIAASYESQGKNAEAIAAYKDLIEHRPSDTPVPQAKFAVANLLEHDNKPDQALNYFEDITRTDPYGSLGSEAGMRAEELKQKFPNLVPPAPTPTASGPLTIPPQPVLAPAPGSNLVQGSNTVPTLRSAPPSNAAPHVPILPPTSTTPAPPGSKP